eukprot:GILJ01009236.1.p1 GENE.GILJ01009236.1~~GILJ01009236.1.p1  ORF type:complete len:841 (-),score=141.00 GILJ01009236.1:472-2994(-)
MLKATPVTLTRLRTEEDKKAAFAPEIKELQQRKERRKMDLGVGPSAFKEKRLLVIANRLPVTIKKEDGDWKFNISSGGLVSALRGVKGFKMVWIGWPGGEIAAEDQEPIKRKLAEENCVPVYLDNETVNLYYNGFSNNVLWPLFHYIPPPMDDQVVGNYEKQWAAYQKANSVFTDAIMDAYEEGDLVWVHDYHLMLVPQMLRERKSDIKTGFFLHTPFPSSEIYRMLPYRSEILRGVLSSNLVGFHVYDYTRHFLNSCTRILGLECTSRGVDAMESGGCFVSAGTFPIGIDPQNFTEALEKPSVKEYIEDFKVRFGDRKVILGIDRLDYIKGIPHKLLALDRFLTTHPDWKDNVVLIQLAVPSRTDVPEYQKLKCQVHEMVGRINGKYGSLDRVPIHYLDQSLNFEKLVALYSVADVCFISSLRDGMNLVAYEYVASQKEKHGVLILSEFAGAAQSLGAGAIRVNPWNVEDMSLALEQALMMPVEEREERHDYTYNYVHTYTAQRWAERFVSDLKEASQDTAEATAAIPPPLSLSEVVKTYTNTKRRLIVLGLIGTIAPIAARRRSLRVKRSVVESISTLCSDPNNTVLVMSSFGRDLVEHAVGHLSNVWLAAESGFCYKQGGNNNEWKSLIDNVDLGWMDGVAEVFQYFVERTPGSYVERTNTSLSWHYKDAIPDFGAVQAKDLLVHLWAGPLTNAPAEVVVGAFSVEVRPANVSKAAVLERLTSTEFGSINTFDFALCMGNFLWKDEDVFAFLSKGKLVSHSSPLITRKSSYDLLPSSNGVSEKTLDLNAAAICADRKTFLVTVGSKTSHAQYHVRDNEEVTRLLYELASVGETKTVG